MPRENAETTRDRRSRKASFKGPDSAAKLRRNCGEIRCVGNLRRFRDRYMRLRLRMNRSSFSSFLPYAFLFPFLLSNPREITRLRNCIETAFKAQKDLLHNPLLKSSYFVVIRGNRSYTCKILNLNIIVSCD